MLLRHCLLPSFGASTWAANFAYVGSFWASFGILFDPHGPQLILSPIALTLMNPQSKLKKAETSVIGEIAA